MALETELEVLKSVVNKLDSSLEKISEVSNSIGKLLAVHDERIEQCNRSDDLLIKMINDLKVDNSKDHNIVVSRINDMEKKVDELSKFRWVVGGIGVLAVIMASTVTTLASGWLSPFEVQYNQNNQSIQK